MGSSFNRFSKTIKKKCPSNGKVKFMDIAAGNTLTIRAKKRHGENYK
jgi:hypothetical protein